LLLLALSGARDDLVFGDDYLPTPANNSDLVSDPVEDLEADLAQGRWFEREGFDELVPELVLGEELENFRVHPATGEVVAQFSSGRIERGCLLVGADGAHSKVRGILSDSEVKYKAAHAGACIMQGVTRLHVPPVDTPDALENGKPIEDLLREDVHEFCPDGRGAAIVARGSSFTVTNLGNGLVGWNLIVSQSEPNQYATSFSMAKTRKMMSEAIAKNPRTSIMMMPTSQLPNLQNVQTDTRSAEDKWGSSSSSTPPPISRSPLSPRMADLTPDILEESDDEDTAQTSDVSDTEEKLKTLKVTEEPAQLSTSSTWDDAGEGSSSSTSSETASFADSPASRRRRHNTSTPAFNMSDVNFQAHLRAQLEQPSRTASLPVNNVTTSTPSFIPSFMPNLFAPPEPLNGTEIRTLALRLSQDLPLPHPCHAIIARTDPLLTSIQDIEDLADEPLESFSFTPPNTNTANNNATNTSTSVPSKPIGRVILIGDAGHPIATTATGNTGAGLAMTDAALLAKLLAKNLARASSILDESQALATTAIEYDKERVAMATATMKDARAEGGWGLVENQWVRSLMRIGRSFIPTTWTRASYATMLTRGAVKSGLPSLMPLGA
jgi:2-polyprenyl-6-methoxyphenol hydroxylase-like FAD-dependent oxidoreductase